MSEPFITSSSTTDPRTPERIRYHFEVEKELADQLRRSSRSERTELFKTLYPELFRRVPDHPRLTRRETPEQSRRSVEIRLRLLRPVLTTDKILLEFAPGDCRLCFAAAQLCRKVIGADISDQRDAADAVPENFEFVVYDGYELDLPDESVDVAFSYQMLEHLHPEDLPLHFELARRLLKPGGVYLFDTPHRHAGPHDISQFFSPVPEGFHLKEYTYSEMASLLRDAGFSKVRCVRGGRIRKGLLALPLTIAVEKFLALLPRRWRRAIARRKLTGVTLAAVR
jgi:SAM-dependent methyltransferase